MLCVTNLPYINIVLKATQHILSGSREVLKALSKTVNLYHRWNDLQAEPITLNLLKEEIERTTTELRNSLRSIEWDLEDLEDTIDILFSLLSVERVLMDGKTWF